MAGSSSARWSGSEWELIELPTLPFHDDEHLAGAPEGASGSAESFVTARNDDALSRCRKAFESAAKHAGKGQDRQWLPATLERAYRMRVRSRPLL